ncbi:MAG: ATP-binding cassette domain-containing protein, partial [Clostridia bacterium]
MLELINIRKSYGTKKVLDDVSAIFPDGKICGLMGVNGCGKSTLMKIICSLALQDSGKILCNGEELSSKFDIGYMIEAPTFVKS